jgi:opacity protein-like surface antigen
MSVMNAWALHQRHPFCLILGKAVVFLNPPGALATTTGHQESNTRSGWTVGGGIEYAVSYGWSLKSEFLYVKFDDYTTFTNGPFSVTGGNIHPRTVKLEDYISRVGLNYKFW